MKTSTPKPFVKSLRSTRPLHRYLGIALSLFLLISTITGILLSWKKQVEWLQPKEQIKQQLPDSVWLSISELKSIADEGIAKSTTERVSLDRIDVRITKGFAKLLYQPGDWEVQIHGQTGEILSIGQRNADWIERLHDGSIISEGFKLISMNGLGFGLLVLVSSGIWLWLGPNLIKRKKIK